MDQAGLPSTLEAPGRRHAPPGGATGLPYLPALDGLRAISLVLVLLFHSQLTMARGGHLGVTIFFVISGFLITSLLLLERQSTGGISALRFWGRRARRLVPAALVCTGLIAVLSAFRAFGTPSGLVGDGSSALMWLANWRFIVNGSSYADMFATPSPFRHFWSLAVEEQMYLVLPLVLIVLTRRRLRRGLVGAGLVAAIAGSTAASFVLHRASMDRAYYGTDTRIAEPLIGALLALFLLAPAGFRRLPAGWRWALEAAALGSFATLGYLVTQLGVSNPRLHQGGLLLAALLAAVVVTACTQPGSLVGRWLSSTVLVSAGRVSYGAYLFHWPIFLWLTERSTGLPPVPLFVVRVTLTFFLAAVSYQLIETPIRFQLPTPKIAILGWANGALAAVAALALVTTQMPKGDSAVASPSGAVPPPPPIPGVAKRQAPTNESLPARPDQSGEAAGAAQPQTGQGPMPETPSENSEPPSPPPEGGSLRVVVLGDSVSSNLAWGLSAWGEAEDVVVYDLSVPACPLSRGGNRRLDNGEFFPIPAGCDWWDNPGSERWKALARFQPDVVVLQDGPNELPDRKLDGWPAYRRPGEPAFDNWLRNEYGALISQLRGMGASVLSLNAVCADWQRWNGWSTYSSRVPSLNATVYPGLTVNGARVGDFNSKVCPGGRYSNSVEGIENARPDGLHFSKEASLAIARKWLGPLVLETNAPAPAPTG